jgi:hypothetical protein
MSVQFTNPPNRSSKELEAGLARYRGHRMISETFATSAPKTTEIDFSHSIYFARLKNVQAGVGLQYARPKVWRYFLKPSSNGETAAAEVNIENSDRHTFALFTDASVVKGHRELLRSFSQEASSRGDFEFRTLKIPSIHVFAIWFRSKRKTQDLLVPLVPQGHFLNDGYFYSRGEFEDVIRKEALRRPASNPNSN